MFQHDANVGNTPDPCGLVSPVSAQAYPSNGSSGVVPSGNGVFWLAEGRVGSLGQLVSYTINGRTVPWIWNVVEFDSSGNLVTPPDGNIFPTYSIYKNGGLVLTCPQTSDPMNFIAQNASNQRLVAAIPSAGLTSCH
jgi:hypothetical protein